MSRRPWPLIIIAILHVIAPVGNITFSAFLSGVGFNVYWRALLMPMNRGTLLIFTVVPITGAILIYMCKRWSYYVYIALMAIPFYFSYQEYLEKSTPMVAAALVLFYVINIFVVGYFLLPTVRQIYFDPRLRWWETKPRYKADFQCQVELQGEQHWVEIKNISEGGAFLETPANLPMNLAIKIYFKDSEGVIALNGNVVYRRSTIPVGYGFKFDRQSAKEPRLKDLIKKLAHDGALIQSRAPLPEDSFMGWLKSVFVSRKKSA